MKVAESKLRNRLRNVLEAHGLSVRPDILDDLTRAAGSADPLFLLRTQATVSVAQAAEMLGVSRAHAYNVVDEGGIPVIKVGRKRVRVPSAQLLAIIEGRDNRSAADQ